MQYLTTLYKNVNELIGSNTFISLLSNGSGPGVVEDGGANQFAAEFEFDCQQGLNVISASTPGQCYIPDTPIDITFSEIGTIQSVYIEFCDVSNNCVVASGASPYVLNSSLV